MTVSRPRDDVDEVGPDDDFSVADLARAATLAGMRLTDAPWIEPYWWQDWRGMDPEAVLEVFEEHDPLAIRQGRRLLEDQEEFMRTTYPNAKPLRGRRGAARDVIPERDDGGLNQ